MLIINSLFKTSVLSKKNNPSPISDADREIPTLESTDIMQEMRFPALSICLGVRISLSALETDDRFYISI